MKVTIERKNSDYLMEAKGASGVPVFMDHSGAAQVQGASPMELVLMGVGGCSAIDIIDILKKQRQTIDSYKVEVEGVTTPRRAAKPFKSIALNIYLEGAIVAEKALRAAELSFEKYCSVAITLEDVVDIVYVVFLNGDKITLHKDV